MGVKIISPRCGLALLSGAPLPGLPGVSGISDHIYSINRNSARCRYGYADNLVHQGGLTGAVGTQQPEDLPLGHGKADIIIGLYPAAVCLADVIYL